MVPSPERLVFLGLEHRVRLRINLHDATNTETAPGVSELLIFHPVDTIAKRLMSNKAKVVSQPPHSGTRLYLVEGLLYKLDHFPRRRFSTFIQEAVVALPWSRICCGVQNLTADLQVRRPTLVQRLDQEKL